MRTCTNNNLLVATFSYTPLIYYTYIPIIYPILLYTLYTIILNKSNTLARHFSYFL